MKPNEGGSWKRCAQCQGWALVLVGGRCAYCIMREAGGHGERYPSRRKVAKVNPRRLPKPRPAVLTMDGETGEDELQPAHVPGTERGAAEAIAQYDELRDVHWCPAPTPRAKP